MISLEVREDQSFLCQDQPETISRDSHVVPCCPPLPPVELISLSLTSSPDPDLLPPLLVQPEPPFSLFSHSSLSLSLPSLSFFCLLVSLLPTSFSVSSLRLLSLLSSLSLPSRLCFSFYLFSLFSLSLPSLFSLALSPLSLFIPPITACV